MARWLARKLSSQVPEEPGHASIHVVLVVAVKKPLAWIIGYELECGLAHVRPDHYGVLSDVLGAIDFGLIADGSVVMVENILRQLRARRADESALRVVQEAAQEVAQPIFFGVAIIVLVYAPVLTLGGVEGKMFRPMALTVLCSAGLHCVMTGSTKANTIRD